MTNGRASIFDDDGPELDASTFTTKPLGANRPDASAVRAVAESAGFPSREPSAPAAPTRRRRPTTGRNVQFNMKISPDYLARFDALTERLNCHSKAETLELAIEALEQKTAGGA